MVVYKTAFGTLQAVMMLSLHNEEAIPICLHMYYTFLTLQRVISIVVFLVNIILRPLIYLSSLTDGQLLIIVFWNLNKQPGSCSYYAVALCAVPITVNYILCILLEHMCSAICLNSYIFITVCTGF